MTNTPCATCGSTAGPQFYGLPSPDKTLDGPFCEPCWKPYFRAHRDALTLQRGVQVLFRKR